MLLRCESLEPPMSQLGQERRISAVRNISALPRRADVGADILEPPVRANKRQARIPVRLAAPSDFAERDLWNPSRDHSGLMFAARITLPHFSVSSATNFVRTAEGAGNGSMPRSASRVFVLSSARALLISLLSLSTMAAGVLSRKATAYQWVAS